MRTALLGLALGLFLAAPAAAETLTMTSGSWAKFTATAPTRENGVHGLSQNVRGQIVLPGGRFEDAKAEVGIPVLSFAAKEGMDQHTYTTVKASLFPMVIFRSKRIEVESREPEGEATRVKGKVTGILHFHGQQRPVSSDFDGIVARDAVEIDTEFKISLTEFGVHRPVMAIFQVDDPVLITVHLHAGKATTLSSIGHGH